jgi:hypothetical protein
MFRQIPSTIRLPHNCRDILHAANLRHGTDGFTYPPTGGVLRIFLSLKIWRLRPGLNPRTWVPKASTLPLDHRSHCRWCIRKKKIPRDEKHGVGSHKVGLTAAQLPDIAATLRFYSFHLVWRPESTNLCLDFAGCFSHQKDVTHYFLVPFFCVCRCHSVVKINLFTLSDLTWKNFAVPFFVLVQRTEEEGYDVIYLTFWHRSFTFKF